MGEQTEKSPSDEGFTELEPTVNGSTDEAEGTSCRTLDRDQHELLGQSLGQSPGQGDHKNQTRGKLDDEEDEGVAQNTSIEDGESILSSSEAEKQGDLHNKPTNQMVTETKDANCEGTEKLLNGVDDKITSAPVDQIRRQSLKQASEVDEKSGPDRPAEEDELSEEERQKKTYELEMKSWLLKRMQAPIEGTRFQTSMGLK